MKPIWTAALIFSAGAAAAQEEAPSFSAEVEAWHAAPSGWLDITRASAAGSSTRVEIGDEIDVDAGLLPVLSASARISGRHAIGLRYLPVSLSGEETLSKDFIYHGTSYAAGRRVESRINLTLQDLDWQARWDAGGGLTLTSHLGIEVWRYSGRLRTEDALPTISERRSFMSLYGLAGVDADLAVHESVDLRFSFIGGVHEASKHFVETRAGVAWSPRPGLSLAAGARLHDLRFEQGTNEADLRLAGPYVGVEISF